MVLAQCLRAGKAPARLCTWHCWEGEEQGVMLRALEGARAFSLPPSEERLHREGLIRQGLVPRRELFPCSRGEGTWFLECLRSVSFCKLQGSIISNLKSPVCTPSDAPGHLSLIKTKMPRLRHLLVPLSKLILI